MQTRFEHPVYELQRGTLPLLVSIPHVGTEIPDAMNEDYTVEARRRADTDWHLDVLYDFAASLGATVLQARVSRYVIDLNRPPDGASLYPGQLTTGLCPTHTFSGLPLYAEGREPSASEIQRRVTTYWQPYHQALREEIARLRALHGQVLLWEAHSIASVLPRLFEGTLPDLNFGTNSAASCDVALLKAALSPLQDQQRYSFVIDGRFKGGYITRHYGQPEQGVHALQLEMSQGTYMDEAGDFALDPVKAKSIQALLQRFLVAGLKHLEAGRSPQAQG